MGNCCSGGEELPPMQKFDVKAGMQPPQQGSGTLAAAVTVGIDFGTSRTGYAYSVNESDIKVQSRWPEDSSPKTPSLLLYRIQDGHWEPVAWGMSARSKYANLIPAEIPNHVLVHSFKLWLRSEKLYQNATKDFPPGCPSPLNIIADYLRFVGQHLHEHLSGTLGKAYEPRAVKFCLTVPAGWTNDEKQSMRQAAAMAGLVEHAESARISLVYEPEAAAVTATFDQVLELKAGDSFMVLDAGGGTVDITMHSVGLREGGRRVLLSECMVPKCLIQGSTILDRHFELHMLSKLGDNKVYARWRQQYPQDNCYMMTKEWEAQKLAFTGKEPCIIKLELSLYEMLTPAAKEALKAQSGGYANKLLLSVEEMAGLFDKVIAPICKDVKDMIRDAKKQPHHILLTGGLGSSFYLLSQLKQQFATYDINIVKPDFAYAAVVQGAVLHGQHPDTITARCSQQTYGIKVYGPWMPGMPEAGVYDPLTQQQMVRGAFMKMVELGQVVQLNETVVREFSPVDKAATHVMIDIYGSSNPHPHHVDDPGVTLVGSVAVPINMAVWQQVAHYLIRLTFRFGGAEIGVTAQDMTSNAKVQASVRFLSVPVDDETPLW